jgi:manganese transport protein
MRKSLFHPGIKRHAPRLTALSLFQFIGPGFLVTVGFIDPGNWAANVAAGAEFGYRLLWVVTLSTAMLIMLQHNAAHLGIATGECLSESATRHFSPWLSRPLLGTAVLAAVFTAFAEILGAAIALNMLFHLPIRIGAVIAGAFVFWMLFSNSYLKIEKWVIGFVSLIGLSFVFELSLVRLDWRSAGIGWVTPVLPHGAILIVMSILGAVVMPHNLFLHSEIIQSRQWNLKNRSVIRKQLNFEFTDTIFSMVVGWAINSAVIILAAAVFFRHGIVVDRLDQAEAILRPLLGQSASTIFAVALLLAGLASSVTAGMAGGSIFAGIFREPYDIQDSHSRLGVSLVIGLAIVLVFLTTDPFKGLIYSQVFLSMQLPFTAFMLIALTSSKKVMGRFVNSLSDKITLWGIAVIITLLNIRLLLGFFGVMK